MPIQLLPSGPDMGPGSGSSSTLTTRRRFLGGLIAGSAGLALGRPAFAHADESKPADWFALVSDIHIGANPSKITMTENPFDNLHTAVRGIFAEAKDKDDPNHKPPHRGDCDR